MVTGGYSIRPGRTGFVVGALIIAAGLVGGGVLLVIGVLSAVGSMPAFTTQIEPGSPQVVQLSRSGEWGMYSGISGAGPATGKCMIKPLDGGTVTTSTPTSSLEFTRDGRQWNWRANFQVSAAGRYQFTCTAEDGTDKFAVGDKPDVSGFASRLVGGILGMVILPLLGIGGGLVVIIITARRRSAARIRLQQQQWGPPPPQMPGTW